MVFLRFFLLALLLSCILRCPVQGQRVASSISPVLGGSSGENTPKCVKYFSRNFTIRDNGESYLRFGLRYDRATALSTDRFLSIERQARAGFPVLAGYRLGRLAVEAGGFLGLGMCRPQKAFLFNSPEQRSREFTNASGLMLAMGVDVLEDCRLSLQYTHVDDLPDNTALGRVNIGWEWNW